MRHPLTWKRWLMELSPISPIVQNVPSETIGALAIALAYAAPCGPSGMMCEDECECGIIEKTSEDEAFRDGFLTAIRSISAEIDRARHRIGR